MKFALVGLGNCATALLQGIAHYREGGTSGLRYPIIGGIRPGDLRCAAAFDVDARKVGNKLSVAMTAAPNVLPARYANQILEDIVVMKGPVLDGIAPHMNEYPIEKRFDVSANPDVDVAEELRKSGAEVLVCYLPVGSQLAAEYYADAALRSGVAFANCIPVFLASNPIWANRFTDNNVPIVGDDIKSQLGATILHRSIVQLFSDRGCIVENTYQINVGGNTDFLNMQARDRLASKKASKTESVVSLLPNALSSDNIHIGPADFVPWLSVCLRRC